MNRFLSIFLVMFVLVFPGMVNAQSVLPQINIIPTQNVANSENKVHILVEADTYTPAFYKGRPEPTANNTFNLIAITENLIGSSYQWKVGSNNYKTTSPRLSIKAPVQKQILVTVNVLDAAGTTLAKTSEYIQISEPELVFYEYNPLRAQSRVGIKDTYTLVGNDADIYAEPYFVGSLDKTVTKWSINGLEQDTVGPFQLTIIKPEDTSESLPVQLTTYNTVRLSERMNGGFTLNFGI